MRATLITLLLLFYWGSEQAAKPSEQPLPASTNVEAADFKLSLANLAPCLDIIVQGVDAGKHRDLIHIEITQRDDLAACGCVFPRQTWLPADFTDASGQLIYGVDLQLTEALNVPSLQTFELYHTKFHGYEKPYHIEIRCETTLPPG